MTLVRTGIETMFAETTENLVDMLLVFHRVIGVDGDISVEEVAEDVFHESLESGQSIGQPKRHNKPFEGSIMSPKCRLPFVTFHNADYMIGMTEINGGIEVGFTCSGQEVRNEWKWIMVLFGNLVQPTEIDTETE